MKIRWALSLILVMIFLSYSNEQQYSSWYKDPRWSRPILHSVAWTTGLTIVGGLSGLLYGKANNEWPAYAVGIDVTIGSLIGAGVGFTGGTTYGIISGQKIHKRNSAARGLSISFEF